MDHQTQVAERLRTIVAAFVVPYRAYTVGFDSSEIIFALFCFIYCGMSITADQVYKLVWSTIVHTEGIIPLLVVITMAHTAIIVDQKCIMVIHEVEQEVTIHLDIPMEIVMRILLLDLQQNVLSIEPIIICATKLLFALPHVLVQLYVQQLQIVCNTTAKVVQEALMWHRKVKEQQHVL